MEIDSKVTGQSKKQWLISIRMKVLAVTRVTRSRLANRPFRKRTPSRSTKFKTWSTTKTCKIFLISDKTNLFCLTIHLVRTRDASHRTIVRILILFKRGIRFMVSKKRVIASKSWTALWKESSTRLKDLTREWALTCDLSEGRCSTSKPMKRSPMTSTQITMSKSNKRFRNGQRCVPSTGAS